MKNLSRKGRVENNTDKGRYPETTKRCSLFPPRAEEPREGKNVERYQ